MRGRTLYLTGLAVLLLLLLLPRQTDTPAHAPWQGPAGTLWAGTELRGMQAWGGYFSGVRLKGEYIELRCKKRPFLRTQQEYWPGAEWRSEVHWSPSRATYEPGWKTPGPGVNPIGFEVPWWLKFCPTA